MISDDELDALRALIGTRLPLPARPHVEYATIDTIRSFARNTGDANPLYGDPDVAARSRYGGIIAPPLFYIASGSPAPDAPTSEPSALVVLRGTHVEVRFDNWTFHEPVRLGTRLVRTDTITKVGRRVDERPTNQHVNITIESRFTSGSTLHATNSRTRIHRRVVLPGSGEILRPMHRYSDEDIEAIEREIVAWSRRGAVPRLWTSLAEVEHIGPLVKGPLTVTDLVAYRAGVGAGPFDVEPLELAIENRKRHPRFYDRGDANAWDARERLHWDKAYAVAQGHTSAYDYSHTRLVWAAQLVTDWMGDSGTLESMTFTRMKNNYVGDTHWLRGHVLPHKPGEEHGRVRIVMDIENQLGERTASAAATALLPMR